MSDGDLESARSVLFVCLGNICRSPTAEAVMVKMLRERGLEGEVTVDSAGVGHWHVGEPPDRRASGAAAGRGVEMTGRARQVQREDFEKFDLIVAMDSSNRQGLMEIAGDSDVSKVRMLREFEPGRLDGASGGDLDVPDPYYGGPDGFDRVLDMIEAACSGLIERLRPRGG